MLIRVKYPHPYCKANILSYCSVNINIVIGIGQMCFDISVSDRIGYLPYRWITSRGSLCTGRSPSSRPVPNQDCSIKQPGALWRFTGISGSLFVIQFREFCVLDYFAATPTLDSVGHNGRTFRTTSPIYPVLRFPFAQ